MSEVRVLLADDHTLVRAGVRRLIEAFADIEVVAEAEHGDQVLDLVALHRPDIAVLDISMPGRNGMEVTADLHAQYPEVAVVIMSMFADLGYVQQALRAGAVGFVVKEAAPAELELALRAAADGRTYLSPKVSESMVRSYVHGGAPNVDALSPRQRQILGLLGKGLSTKEIAADLGISAKTVETHRARVMEALGMRRAADIIRFAIMHGLA